MYPDSEVEGFIRNNFVPVKIHIKEQPKTFERFGAQWTPTMVVAEPDGTERHRFEGFLPKDEFLGQIRLGLAHAARARSEWSEAERRYRELADSPAAGDAAPESLYWAGVSKYKASNDASALADTARAFKEKYSDTSWAKKASVWG